MAQEKEQEKQQEISEAQATAEGMPEPEEQTPADVDALKRQLEDAETKLAESLDGWQRSLERRSSGAGGSW